MKAAVLELKTWPYVSSNQFMVLYRSAGLDKECWEEARLRLLGRGPSIGEVIKGQGMNM